MSSTDVTEGPQPHGTEVVTQPPAIRHERLSAQRRSTATARAKQNRRYDIESAARRGGFFATAPRGAVMPVVAHEVLPRVLAPKISGCRHLMIFSRLALAIVPFAEMRRPAPPRQ